VREKEADAGVGELSLTVARPKTAAAFSEAQQSPASLLYVQVILTHHDVLYTSVSRP